MQGCGALGGVRSWVTSQVESSQVKSSQVKSSQVKSSQVKSSQVHVHVNLPSRQDAPPQVPWRHSVEDADTSSLVKFCLSSHVCARPRARARCAAVRARRGPLAGHLISHLHLTPDTPPARSPTAHWLRWLPQRGFLILLFLFIFDAHLAPRPRDHYINDSSNS